jgi:hypothetical protein
VNALPQKSKNSSELTPRLLDMLRFAAAWSLFLVIFDSHGNIYVANSEGSSITEYAAGSNGDVAPIATIVGPNTGLSIPFLGVLQLVSKIAGDRRFGKPIVSVRCEAIYS